MSADAKEATRSLNTTDRMEYSDRTGHQGGRPYRLHTAHHEDPPLYTRAPYSMYSL